MAEFGCPPAMDNVMVTSTKHFAWVTPRDGRVRAASRKLSLPAFFMSVVREVADVGAEAEWGNVRDMTQEGVSEVLAHLASYGFEVGHLEALTAPGEGHVQEILTAQGVGCRPTSWVSPGYVVLVPLDRDFVGVLHVGSDGQGFAVVHNPSRAIGVLRLRGSPSP